MNKKFDTQQKLYELHSKHDHHRDTCEIFDGKCIYTDTCRTCNSPYPCESVQLFDNAFYDVEDFKWYTLSIQYDYPVKDIPEIREKLRYVSYGPYIKSITVDPAQWDAGVIEFSFIGQTPSSSRFEKDAEEIITGFLGLNASKEISAILFGRQSFYEA